MKRTRKGKKGKQPITLHHHEDSGILQIYPADCEPDGNVVYHSTLSAGRFEPLRATVTPTDLPYQCEVSFDESQFGAERAPQQEARKRNISFCLDQLYKLGFNIASTPQVRLLAHTQNSDEVFTVVNNIGPAPYYLMPLLPALPTYEEYDRLSKIQSSYDVALAKKEAASQELAHLEVLQSRSEELGDQNTLLQDISATKLRLEQAILVTRNIEKGSIEPNMEILKVKNALDRGAFHRRKIVTIIMSHFCGAALGMRDTNGRHTLISSCQLNIEQEKLFQIQRENTSYKIHPHEIESILSLASQQLPLIHERNGSNSTITRHLPGIDYALHLLWLYLLGMLQKNVFRNSVRVILRRATFFKNALKEVVSTYNEKHRTNIKINCISPFDVLFPYNKPEKAKHIVSSIFDLNMQIKELKIRVSPPDISVTERRLLRMFLEILEFYDTSLLNTGCRNTVFPDAENILAEWRNLLVSWPTFPFKEEDQDITDRLIQDLRLWYITLQVDSLFKKICEKSAPESGWRRFKNLVDTKNQSIMGPVIDAINESIPKIQPEKYREAARLLQSLCHLLQHDKEIISNILNLLRQKTDESKKNSASIWLFIVRRIISLDPGPVESELLTLAIQLEECWVLVEEKLTNLVVEPDLPAYPADMGSLFVLTSAMVIIDRLIEIENLECPHDEKPVCMVFYSEEEKQTLENAEKLRVLMGLPPFICMLSLPSIQSRIPSTKKSAAATEDEENNLFKFDPTVYAFDETHKVQLAAHYRKILPTMPTRSKSIPRNKRHIINPKISTSTPAPGSNKTRLTFFRPAAPREQAAQSSSQFTP